MSRDEMTKEFKNIEDKCNNLHASTRLLVQAIDKEMRLKEELAKHQLAVKRLREHIRQMEAVPVAKQEGRSDGDE